MIMSLIINDGTRHVQCSFVLWQEIAWQRLDELQPANDDVISRGITGLKLYMVAPFLT